MWVDSSNDDSGTPEVSKPLTICVCVTEGGTTVISVCQRMMLLLCCDTETGQSTSFSCRQTDGDKADIQRDQLMVNVVGLLNGPTSAWSDC